MYKRAPLPGRLTLACLCLAIAVVLFFAGRRLVVAVRPEASVAAKVAHLSLVNRSNCEWQIALAPVVGGEQRTWKLPLAKSLEVELPGGDYMVEQTMLTEDAGPDSVRRFPLRLEAGETYRWRLVTLLSGEADDVRVPTQTNAAHE